MEKIFDEIFNDYRGVILFLVIIAMLSFLFTLRIRDLNSISASEKNTYTETYYA